MKDIFTRSEVEEIARRFKKDTELFSGSKLVKEHGASMTYPEIENKWFQENLYKGTETVYNGEHYLIPYDEMDSWYAYIRDMSVFQKDAGNLQIAFSDAFSKYRIKG